jgi:hypothetical protein
MNGLRKCIAGIAALGMIAGATLPASAVGPNRALGASQIPKLRPVPGWRRATQHHS